MFPIYKQLDSSDCGPTCLRMIAKFFGRDLSPVYLRKISNTTRAGTNFSNMIFAAKIIGLEASPVRITKQQLFNVVNLPVIVHWNQKHFVVVYKIKKTINDRTYIYVADPSFGRTKYVEKDFLKYWGNIEGDKKGIALLLYPNELFNHQKNEYVFRLIPVQ
jgi:ATP-binding cassette subfamily B protein